MKNIFKKMAILCHQNSCLWFFFQFAYQLTSYRFFKVLLESENVVRIFSEKFFVSWTFECSAIISQGSWLAKIWKEHDFLRFLEIIIISDLFFCFLHRWIAYIIKQEKIKYHMCIVRNSQVVKMSSQFCPLKS